MSVSESDHQEDGAAPHEEGSGVPLRPSTPTTDLSSAVTEKLSPITEASTPVREELEVPVDPAIEEIKVESSDAKCSVLSEGSAVTGDASKPEDASEHEAAPTSKNLASVSVTSYHMDSDLYIEVRKPEGTVMYKVYSALIAAASPVWRKMIYGGDYPRPDHGKWVINMLGHDDSAYGLDIIFSIIHYKFHEIPERPDIDQLYGIAQVVDKYECPHLLVSYMKQWVTGLNWHVVMNDSRHDNDDDKTMFLTWVLGEGRWFSRVVSRVAYKATVDEDGALLDSKGRLWESQGIPSDVLDVVVKTRKDALTRLIPAISLPLQELMDAPQKRTMKHCRSKDATDEIKEQCQLQQLGSLISGLTFAGLLPLPDVEKYKGSVIDLADKLAKVKVAHYKMPGIQPHQDSHSSCGVHHKQALSDSMPTAVPLGGKIIVELKKRAQKSGAFSDELFRELKSTEDEDHHVQKEDLKMNSTHFKQEEEFGATPDYYDQNCSGIVIKVEDVDA